MVIAAGQEVLFALLDPFFLFVSLTLRTMPVTAGVVADGKISATITRINMTTQGRSPAVGQCPKRLFLMNAEVLG
ncbi:Uncharacterised protein [Chryseobacterium indoltheticum]|uniref:Uncharacterized protein n=1 Tax=Chryseobacterium indoltheticum TaxID=254 RepID=A0A381FIK6_9FLAO|nr:Uncharacterised protein [Chryseobacterium indoltheticum]